MCLIKSVSLIWRLFCHCLYTVIKTRWAVPCPPCISKINTIMTLWRFSLPWECRMMAQSVKGCRNLCLGAPHGELTPVFKAGTVAGCQAALCRCWADGAFLRGAGADGPCGHKQEPQLVPGNAGWVPAPDSSVGSTGTTLRLSLDLGSFLPQALSGLCLYAGVDIPQLQEQTWLPSDINFSLSLVIVVIKLN